MKKIALSFITLVFFSALFYSCKKETTSPLIANWTLTDTTNTTANTLTLNITDNTNYNMSAVVNGTFLAYDTGTYGYSSNIVTFTSTGATSPCLNRAGTYSYSISGNYLTLMAISDSCYFSSYQRDSLVSSKNWIK